MPLLLLLLLTLQGCATTGKTDRTQPTKIPRADESQMAGITAADRLSATEWLERAEQIGGSEQITAFLNAASQLQREQQWQAAAAVLAQLEYYFSPAQFTPRQQQLLRLLTAQFAAQQQQWDEVTQATALLLSEPLADDYLIATLNLQLRAAQAQRRWQFAAQTQLRLLDSSAATRQTDNQAVWKILRNAPKPQDLQANTPNGRGWQQLLVRLHRAALEPVQADAQLTAWQQQYPEHPGQQIVDDFQQTATTAANTRQALVLLPLSGPYAAQGQAVRDGMVMALTQLKGISIEVVDTAQLNFDTLPERLQQTQASLLIGPLLKENIPRVPTARLPEQLHWLTLNELAEAQLGQVAAPQLQQLFYALDSETEVRQAAQFMAKQGYQKPLVLSADSGRGQALSELFANTFSETTALSRLIERGVYDSAEAMKESVQAKLGVTASEARIWQVKIAGGKILVDSQARSRNDIDAIYLVGGIDQTRLLKPFIDVNISPFHDAIPVYANSASHILRNDVSENDLDQVQFTDLPWLLPEHRAHEQLQRLLALRSNWDYNLARLAAFGHDSIYIGERMHWLSRLPGLSLTGLTGELQVQGQRVQRQLQWARYRGHQVVPVR